jgi:DNA-binding NarL/FixJ family response regulator
VATVALSIADAALSARLEAALSEVGLRVAADKRGADVVLTDGIEGATPTGHVPTIVLIDDASGTQALDALNTGAAAVLSVYVDGATLAAAIEAVGRGLTVIPATQLKSLIDGVDQGAPTPPMGGSLDPQLTPRELEVLAALADGVSNKVIARRLGISFHTVKFHVAGILAKLGAETRTEAVAQGARLGLVML